VFDADDNSQACTGTIENAGDSITKDDGGFDCS